MNRHRLSSGTCEAFPLSLSAGGVLLCILASVFRRLPASAGRSAESIKGRGAVSCGHHVISWRAPVQRSKDNCCFLPLSPEELDVQRWKPFFRQTLVKCARRPAVIGSTKTSASTRFKLP